MKTNICQCPNCGELQLSTAKTTFKCVKCNKTKHIKNVKVIKSTDNPLIASEILIEYKRQLNQTKEQSFQSANRL